MKLRLIKKKIFLSLRGFPFVFDQVKKFSRMMGSSSEEYELLKEYKRSRKNAVVLQIGANDGISNDPVREFLIAEKSWQGYLIEPVAHLYDKLKNNYKNKKRIQLFQCAISDSTGKSTIYSYKKSALPDLPFYADQIASFDKNHLTNLFPNLNGLDALIEAIPVDTYSLDHFFRKYRIDQVNVLVIDVEGHEKQIIETFPFTRIKPEIIILEVIHMNEPDRALLFALLKKNGYLFYNSVFDTIAVHNTIAGMRWVKKYCPVNKDLN